MEFIIYKDWRGWGVWYSCEDWKECNALGYFNMRQQAEEFESSLLEQHRNRGKEMKYYDSQLQRVLNDLLEKDQTLTITVRSEDNRTNALNINIDSLESLKAFIDIAIEKLKEG